MDCAVSKRVSTFDEPELHNSQARKVWRFSQDRYCCRSPYPPPRGSVIVATGAHFWSKGATLRLYVQQHANRNAIALVNTSSSVRHGDSESGEEKLKLFQNGVSGSDQQVAVRADLLELGRFS